MTKNTKSAKPKIKWQEVAFNYLDSEVIKEYWHDIDSKNNLYITVEENGRNCYYLVSGEC